MNSACGPVAAAQVYPLVTQVLPLVTQVYPLVKFACGTTRIMSPESWALLEGDRTVAERRQVPLSLAWAVR